MLVDSSEHDLALEVTGQNPHTTFSIKPAAFNDFGLYPRCKLARQWNIAYSGRREMERPEYMRL
jgi:hypothetical protein